MTARRLLDIYRPAKFGDLAQGLTDPGIKKLTTIAGMCRPDSLLIHGHSGCGKTASARIMARRFTCCQKSNHDFEPCEECRSCKERWHSRRLAEDTILEIDCTSGTPGAISDRIEAHLMYSSCFSNSNWDGHVVILDEVHRNQDVLSDRLLKIIEDRNGALFMLLTTDPGKLSEPLRQRCQPVRISKPEPDRCVAWLKQCADGADIELAMGLENQIVAEAGGVPRLCLQVLQDAADFAGGSVVTESNLDDAMSQYDFEASK